jgi:hypothetical protein
MRRFCYLVLAAGAACVWSAGALAEKFTGTCECGKSDPQHLLQAGDRPDHSFGVESAKCSWTKPADLGGDKTKDGVATHMIEISGKKIRFHGVHEVTLQSGDKVALPYQGNGVSKDNHETQSHGTFSLGEATGKLKGIKGKGTFTCKSAGEGVSCEVEGEYELAK